MRAVVVTEPGDAEVLQVQTVPDPVAGPGEVLIRVAAAALNRADVLQRQGNYPPPPGASVYPGMECSGTIVALGADVVGWSIGDEVCALLTGGGYAELVAAPVGQLMPIPAGVSLVDAASLPEAICTVWSMVFDLGQLQPGETVLLHGGTSGIGTMAIQLAHATGARVVTTVGTEHKAEIARSLGADVVINYRSDDFVDVVRSATDGGVDVILDNMGASYLSRNVAALGLNGRLLVLGLQGGVKGEVNLGLLLIKRARIIAASLRSRSLDDKARIVTAAVDFAWPLLADGRVKPVIDRVLSLDDVVEAHRLMESSEHIGKILLRV